MGSYAEILIMLFRNINQRMMVGIFTYRIQGKKFDSCQNFTRY